MFIFILIIYSIFSYGYCLGVLSNVIKKAGFSSTWQILLVLSMYVSSPIVAPFFYGMQLANKKL